MSVLRNDIVPNEFKERPLNVRVIAQGHFDGLLNRTLADKTKTPRPAKNIIEVMDLISQAVSDYELRTHVTEDAKIDVTYSKPDTDKEVEVISMELTRREPGMWGQGSPFENRTQNLRPILREYTDDAEHPAYRKAVLGYFYDNMLNLTCWARTNKAANERALWLENVMEEYSWFFVYSGVNRIFYQGRRGELVHEVHGNKFYGRPIEYFVRTEKIRRVSEKVLEEICIRFHMGDAPQ